MRNRHRSSIVAMFAIATAVACGSPTDSGAPASVEPAELVGASQVSDSVIVALNSGIPDRRRLVIRSEAEWHALWREATASVSPAPDVPRFDFATEMLLVATMGARPTGGYAIMIDSVYAQRGVLHAVVRETVPDRACLVTLAMTTPVVAVRVPRSAAPVEFSNRTGTHICW